MSKATRPQSNVAEHVHTGCLDRREIGFSQLI
jgi:hypothetical protein